MLSNGPGDPAENTACIAEIKKLLGKVPMFGICLGHQLLALAAGGRTEKLKYGHRGANQPCRDLVTGHTYITSQNHGYAVVSDSLPVGQGCASSTPTTRPARAWTTPNTAPSPCSSTPRPAPAPWTRRSCSTNSSI